jgi:hypothetical protein
MDRTVREHIEFLEGRLRVLNEGYMNEEDVPERNRIGAELRAVESALLQFQSALRLEQQLAHQHQVSVRTVGV